MVRRGREFEEAVYQFMTALDPNAKVQFDVKVLDRDTGTKRQVDCWIDAKIGGHIPFSVAVSCKDHRRPVDISKMETFCSEISSTGANMGVMYSSSGYTEPALEKARSLRIQCCRLYRDQPADIPEIIFIDQFLSNPQARVLLLEHSEFDEDVRTWGDLFELAFDSDRGERNVLDVIEDAYTGMIRDVRDKMRKGPLSLPEDLSATILLTSQAKGGPFLKIRVDALWKCFRAKLEAHLLNGSYCLSNASFLGTISGPSIDTWSPHPGPGWEEVQDKSAVPSNAVVMTRLRSSGVRQALQRNLGDQLLTNQEA